jgi:hypothetical protein
MSPECLPSSEEDESSPIRHFREETSVISPPASPTPLYTEDTALRDSISDRPDSIDDLDAEDPLNGACLRDDEFEPFSRTEVVFISISCVGVVAVPLLYLLVSRIQVRATILSKLIIDFMIVRFRIWMVRVRNKKE